MRSPDSKRAKQPALILLVDDNPDGVLARRSVLEELGYRVVGANDGTEALKAAQDENINLVITGYKMAPMDGLELIQALRKRETRVPIILLTGFAEGIGLQLETTGADVILQKSATELVALVRHTKRLLVPSKKPATSQRGTQTKARAQGAG